MLYMILCTYGQHLSHDHTEEEVDFVMILSRSARGSFVENHDVWCYLTAVPTCQKRSGRVALILNTARGLNSALLSMPQ